MVEVFDAEKDRRLDIFLSWSGPRSKAIAEAFRQWLTKSMRSVRPWCSIVDIEQGARWNDSLNKGLNKSKAGIICLTKSNKDNRSILFEAGAISRSASRARVYNLLSELSPEDLAWPLAQFQGTRLVKIEIQKMCKDINRAIAQIGEDSIAEEAFDENFEVWWPKLDNALSNLPNDAGCIARPRSDSEILLESY